MVVIALDLIYTMDSGFRRVISAQGPLTEQTTEEIMALPLQALFKDRTRGKVRVFGVLVDPGIAVPLSHVNVPLAGDDAGHLFSAMATKSWS